MLDRRLKCIRCGHEHIGTEMRTDKRYHRITDMLRDPAMPINKNGQHELCHHCQRWIVWHGGIINYLAGQVLRHAGSNRIHWTARRVSGVRW